LIEEGPEVASLGFFAVRGPIIVGDRAVIVDARTEQLTERTRATFKEHEADG
jgi:dihydrodipicolinate reductase